MVSQHRIRFLGWACLAGGVLEIVGGIFYLLLFGPQTNKDLPAFDLLFLVLFICLLGGPLGLLARRAFGSGVPRILGNIGVGITLLGLLSYIVGMIYILLYPAYEWTQGFTPAGALFSSLGMLLVGIATLAGRQLGGGQAFAPLLIPIAYVLNVVLQVVYFLVTGPHPNPLLPIILLCFGPAWVLVGYALQSSATGKLTVASHA